jgi:hypothetical protein
MSDNKAAESLLKLLQYDSKLPQKDLEACLQVGGMLEDDIKARASVMVQSDEFRIWLAEDDSSRALLVNGHGDLETAETESPLSLADAELVRAFEDTRPAFFVKYFCSLHTENIDPSRASSPVGIMVSLIGELLTQMMDCQMEVDVSFLSKNDLKKVENDDLDILCIVFRELVLQLPPKALLVCVLDEVTLYETESLGRDIGAVMRRLCRLVVKSTEVIFKLLVTCRGQSLEFQQYFQDTDILDLQEDVELDDLAMWRVRNVGGRN